MSPEARRPQGIGWSLVGDFTDPTGSRVFGWVHRASGAQVLSSIALARLPRSGRTGPQWLVSVSSRGGDRVERPSPAQVTLMLCAFDMLAAEQDNHHPGGARHFFLPVDPAERVACECKADEITIVDPDGYTWTNPAGGEECRGCDLAAALAKTASPRPCPIHGGRVLEASP